jgi:ABC-type polysaccharide/polyol phosphate export permease
MEDLDLTSIGLIVIVCSITVAGIIIGAMLLGFPVAHAPYLLIITLVLIVMGAISIFYENTKTNLRK